MRIDIKWCADCFSFLTHVSQYFGGPVEVLEASRKTEFRGDVVA